MAIYLFSLHPSLPPSAAMHMGLGGNPYGPAGTGKTESVKALGGLFGRQVLVFNCDEVSTTQSVTIDLVRCVHWTLHSGYRCEEHGAYLHWHHQVWGLGVLR